MKENTRKKMMAMAAFFALAVTAICGAIISDDVYADDPVTDGDWTYLPSSDTTSSVITAYNGTDTVIVIPDTLGGKPVTKINSDVFKNKPITSVTFPDTLTSIGAAAFQGTLLSEVAFPAAIKWIDLYAFQNIPTLASVVFAENTKLNLINNNAFASTGITEITIPASTTIIGKSVFAGSALETVTIVGNSTFDTHAFYGCANLTEVDFGDLEIITDYMFSNTGITSVSLPDSVTSVGDYAFFGCEDLTSITIGSSVETIGASAFSGCTSLTSVFIPKTVTGIGASAFNGCDLRSAALHYSTSVGSNAFLNNISLPGITTYAVMTINDEIEIFTPIGVPADPSVAGGTIFYVDEEMTEEYDWSAVVTEDLSLYTDGVVVIGGDGDDTVPIMIIILAASAVIFGILAIYTRNPYVALAAVILLVIAGLGYAGYLPLPEIVVPGVNITLPTINWPQINWPTINWPQINWPTINWPQINWPKLW